MTRRASIVTTTAAALLLLGVGFLAGQRYPAPRAEAAQGRWADGCFYYTAVRELAGTPGGTYTELHAAVLNYGGRGLTHAVDEYTARQAVASGWCEWRD